MTEFLVTKSGTAHVLDEEGFTLCGRELEGEIVSEGEAIPTDTHLCENCASVEVEEEPEVTEDAPANAAGVEAVGRSPKSHRRHLGF